MIKSLKRLFWKWLNFLKIGGLIQLYLESLLKDDGWFHSYHIKQSVDSNDNPLPWFTYSFIKFIEPKLSKNFTVYEYGSGNSTLWFSKRVNKVVSMEHDQKWFEKIKLIALKNIELKYKSIDQGTEYEDEILKEEKQFDIVIIDGRKRVECTANVFKKLTPSGVIIFDNSDRKEYTEAYLLLEKQGFRKIDFWGMGPISHFQSCTSVYYREKNCLDI